MDAVKVDLQYSKGYFLHFILKIDVDSSLQQHLGKDLVQMQVERGADMNIQNNDGDILPLCATCPPVITMLSNFHCTEEWITMCRTRQERHLLLPIMALEFIGISPLFSFPSSSSRFDA
jgi:hypothetical protein